MTNKGFLILSYGKMNHYKSTFNIIAVPFASSKNFTAGAVQPPVSALHGEGRLSQEIRDVFWSPCDLQRRDCRGKQKLLLAVGVLRPRMRNGAVRCLFV